MVFIFQNYETSTKNLMVFYYPESPGCFKVFSLVYSGRMGMRSDLQIRVDPRVFARLCPAISLPLFNFPKSKAYHSDKHTKNMSIFGSVLVSVEASSTFIPYLTINGLNYRIESQRQ